MIKVLAADALYDIPFILFKENFKKITKIYSYQIAYIEPTLKGCNSVSQCVRNQKWFPIHYFNINIYLFSPFFHLFIFNWGLCWNFVKKVRVGMELVFCKEIISYSIRKCKGNYCEIYFHREPKSGFVP
jgi:hypothetical protein